MNHDIPAPTLGVLHMNEGAQRFRLIRIPPSQELAPFVKHYWTVKWDLADDEDYTQLVVPNPCVNLVVEPGKTSCFAPGAGTFSYLMQGSGCVFGVKFHPGGFYPFVKEPISGLRGQPIPVMKILGISGEELEKTILSRKDEHVMAEKMERLLLRCLPEADRQGQVLREAVEGIARDRELIKVDMLCARMGLHKRTVQRLFDQYVGVSPKWVIRLFRIQDAAERMDNGRHDELVKLAMDLGYHDQAHFIKDFKNVTGQTPEEYIQGPGSASASV
ncbi:MAG: helix-turn-helix protein [Paenibacillaceae bacterium]|jgi:AraC-like DNA-binding protein|nr:helix-turn-helix protein [Paenibacillaceae bacterium]